MAYEQAPKIHHSVDKNRFITRQDGFAMIPEAVLYRLCEQLDPKSGAQFRLIIFLIGCGESFRLPLKTVMDKLHISKDSYYKARTQLEERGWITCINDSQDPTIIINYHNIMEDEE